MIDSCTRVLFDEASQTHRASLPKSNYNPNGIPILGNYCENVCRTHYLPLSPEKEIWIDAASDYIHPLKAVKRLFCCTPVTNKLMKLGCWLPFSLCVPIQLAVGLQSPERLRCSTSMIVIATKIRKIPITLPGWIVLFSLRSEASKSLRGVDTKDPRQRIIRDSQRYKMVRCEAIQGNVSKQDLWGVWAEVLLWALSSHEIQETLDNLAREPPPSLWSNSRAGLRL